jgi:hypothetical protein
MAKISSYATDKQKTTKGVWVEVSEGLAIKVAYLGSSNTAYQDCVRTLGKPIRKKLATLTADADEMNPIICKAMAKHILLDWRNLEGEDGKSIEYSQAKAEELLLAYPEFRDIVQEIATDVSNFRSQDIEDQVGNLPKSSAGTSSGESTKAS